MTTQSIIENKISEVLRRYPSIEHPLIRGITSRRFTLEEMHLIAERFYHVIQNFPRFLAGMISNLGDMMARMPLVENLFEEHGRMDPRHIHVNTYIKFLEQMGLDTKRITSSKKTPATISYFNSVLHICTTGHPNQGLGALGIIEDIVHQVSALMGGAVKRERNDVEHVSHFSEHEILDDQHSKEIYSMLVLENDHEIDAALHGLTMGAYLHHQLYEAILDEILYESGKQKTNFLNLQLPTKSEYPLAVGGKGEERLSLLNELYNSSSQKFIERQFSRPKGRFLEIGCGAGKLSREIAVANPNWNVIATDASPEQISLATKSATHVDNLNFMTGNIDTMPSCAPVDVIYGRWVFIYQKKIDEMIATCTKMLVAGGTLIIEDNEPGASGCLSFSHQQQITTWENFWTQAVSFVGQGPGFCQRLIDAGAQHGLSVVDFCCNQQILSTRNQKLVFMMGIQESKDAILNAGLPLQAFEAILENAAALAESSLPISFVRNFQLAFRKDL